MRDRVVSDGQNSRGFVTLNINSRATDHLKTNKQSPTEFLERSSSQPILEGGEGCP